MRPIPLTSLHPFVFLIVLLIPISWSHGQEAKPKDPGSRPPDSGTDGAITGELLAAHNKVRAEEKKPPLKLNDRLTLSARGHAGDMAERDKLTHEGSDGSKPSERIRRAGYVYKSCGENVAAGQETVAEVMRTWIESPPHRENILADFTEIGVGVAKSREGKKYWCVDFGRPIPPVDPVKSPAAMIAALNRARSEARKRALKADPQLARIAARFAHEAADSQSLTGKDRDGKSPFEVLEEQDYRARKFGVILSSGEGDPAKVVTSWLERKEDRSALLSAFDRVGVGVSTDSDGVPYWVLLLAQAAAQ